MQRLRCVCHTMELSIGDVMRNRDVDRLIILSQKAIAQLRTPIYSTLIKNKGLKRPKKYCVTRWHSIHDMLDSFIALKHFCLEFKLSERVVNIRESDWEKIVQLRDALAHLSFAIIKFQNSQLSMPDFYRYQINCLLTLQKMNSRYSDMLFAALKKRGEDILQSPSLLSSLFLDARFQLLLSDQEKKIAMDHIEKLFNYYNEVEIREPRDITMVENSIINENEDEFSLYLKNKALNKISGPKSIRSIIEEFNNTQPISEKENILNYWELNKKAKPELYFISNILFAVPASEADVERNFSILKFIYSDLRDNLKGDLLQNILIINLNRELFYKNNDNTTH